MQKCCGPNPARCASITTCGAIAAGAASKYFLHQLLSQVMKDQTVSLFTSASMFLTAFCKKGKKKKGRVWDCYFLDSLGVCKLPRTHLAWVHLSTKNN